MLKKQGYILLLLLLLPIVLVALTIWFYFKQHGILPDESKWCYWDCGWYNGMRQHGYIYLPGQQNNLAFFPLFPLVWKTLNVGNIAMGLINYFIFALATIMISINYRISTNTILVFTTVGLSFFFMMPYTESFFFLGSVLILMGFSKSNYWLLAIGALIAIGTRSASMIFLVSFLLMLMLAFMQQKKWADIKLIVFAMLTVFVVNVLVFLYQYQQTDKFFGFFESHQYWDHQLRWPKLKHISWHKPVALTENLALVIGVFCKLVLVTYFINLLSYKYKWSNPLSRLFTINGVLTTADLFVLLYLAGGTTFILLYQQESLASLNRYILSTPFYLLLLHLLAIQKIQVNIKPLMLIGFAIILGFTISHSHIEHKLIMVLAITLTLTTVFLAMPNTTKFYRAISYITCICGMLLQGFLFHFFISGNWVG